MTTKKKNEKKYYVLSDDEIPFDYTLEEAKEEAMNNCECSGSKQYIVTVEYSCIPNKPTLKAGYIK